MGSSLWAGISGLNASSKEMDVIANNIANVNTIGYKAGKTFFSDVLSQSISGGSSGSMQVGRGVQVTDVGTLFGPGSFETTGNSTDVAIDGDGFFIVNDSDGASYYTRAGALHLDSSGNLVDTNGYKLQGQNIVSGVNGPLSDVSLKDVQSSPEVTTIFSIGANLNSATATGDTYTTTQTVYDSLGGKRSLGTSYQKTEENGYWGFQVSLDSTDATTQSYYGLLFDSDGALDKVYSSVLGATTETTIGTGTVSATTFNQPGQAYQDAGVITLTRGATNATWTASGLGVTAAYTNLSVSGATVGATDYVYVDLDGAGGTDITFTLAGVWAATDHIDLASITQTEVDPADISITFGALEAGANPPTIGASNVVTWDLAGTDALDVTGYASASVIRSLTNDGYASGELKSLSVGNTGLISGFFTNGQTADLAQIILADFDNPWGLKKMGSNLFAETVTSGAPIQNTPGSSGMGDVSSNSLEMSNTDVATEFINMITAQKAYSASARVITTQDQMMSELMNIKR